MERLEASRIELSGVEVRIVERCASTNSLLLADPPGAPVLLAAEAQTAGRGRRGSRWHGSAGRDVAFSLARRIARPPRELAALSLVAGVATVRALRSLGVAAAAVKWPNDLVVGAAKLGGILVETRADGAGTTHAVFGIGINCFHDVDLERRLRRPLAALNQFIVPSRNAVIRTVARSLLEALERFEIDGFAPARTAWAAMDAHAGQRLRVRLANGRSISGVGGGVAADGALVLITRSGEAAVHSGRIISARPA